MWTKKFITVRETIMNHLIPLGTSKDIPSLIKMTDKNRKDISKPHDFYKYQSNRS